MSKTPTFFDDEDFQNQLVGLLCRDIQVLQQCAVLLESGDFDPLRGSRWGRARWVVADRALEYYRKFQEPIGRILRSDVLDYSQQIGMGERQVGELLEYLKFLGKQKLLGPEDISAKVVRFKQEKLRAKLIQELAELQDAGQLDNEKWHEITEKLFRLSNHQFIGIDYYEGLEERIQRRHLKTGHSAPLFFIDPLDELIRGPGRGQMGLILAPYGRGKSLFFAWLAVMFTLQRWNTMLVTLEDPHEDVEDRLDSIVSAIPIHGLKERPKLLEKRFARFRRLVRSRLKVIDGTSGGLTIPKIDQIVSQERDRGFYTDALLIDYDDEVVPSTKQKERRFEFADIYRQYRQLLSRRQLVGWIASQTQRGTEGYKVLSGDRLAEDISKIRKATVALGLGQGDWGEESIYLYVAKHKTDRDHIGCHIIPNKKRGMIYDRDLTRVAALEHSDSNEEGE